MIMTLIYSTPACITLIVPFTDESKHISNSDSEDDRLTQAAMVVLSTTIGDTGPIGSVNHGTASFARAWIPGLAVPVRSTRIPEIVAIVVMYVARCAPRFISEWS
ncbi:hypothetical protein BDR03DRAFT_143832 [Suillus americanus]|nr:hypothetical protein BDR03DRAFT_143832 [Suillus americanus]